MDLASAFAVSAEKRPEKVALYWGEQEFTYATLLQQSRAVAAHLAGQHHVQAGDRVGLWLKNRPEFVPALFGILQAGAVVVPINNFLKPAEVSYILQDAGIDLLITEEDLAAHGPELLAARPELKLFQVEGFAGDVSARIRPGLPAEEDASPSPTSNRRPTFMLGAEREKVTGTSALGATPPPAESDLAVIIYTSGTTGRPKGAMLSHGNLLHNVESCRLVLETVDQDRIAVMLPLFHSYMLTVGLLLPLLVGGSLILVKSLQHPRHILQEVCQRQATVLPAIPQYYRALVHAPVPMPLPFRLCISGSAPLPVEVLKGFEAKFKIPLIEGYGLSEASPVVTKNPLRGAHKPGSIGLPLPHVEVSVQNDEGQMLGPNQVGEICVRGGNVMLGYWNKPEETAQVMRNGWLLTGDVGYRDPEGYYYITDRKKDMLLVNGINVYPREIEEVMYQYPGVKEAAVIGVPDARKGEQPVAFVAANDGAVLDDRGLLQFVRSQLADYKIPRKILMLPNLPRNATGKILKTSLRELLSGSGQMG